jgi:ubiquinone/menaquinone biosynthesis C-methylase UbiE
MKKILFGNEVDKMPNFAFKIMDLMFKVYYFFISVDKYINEFGIKKGNTVVDYGCGPGQYIKRASELAGDSGLVYAVDIHELAILSVEKLIKKYSLNNVTAIQTDGLTVGIADNVVDLLYALDMFHMVKDPNSFLKEINRIIKKDCILIIEDGHQSRELSKEKIIQSGWWEIIEENSKYLKCIPIKNTAA